MRKKGFDGIVYHGRGRYGVLVKGSQCYITISLLYAIYRARKHYPAAMELRLGAWFRLRRRIKSGQRRIKI